MGLSIGPEDNVMILPAFPGNHLLEGYWQRGHQLWLPENPARPDSLTSSSSFLNLGAVCSYNDFVSL